MVKKLTEGLVQKKIVEFLSREPYDWTYKPKISGLHQHGPDLTLIDNKNKHKARRFIIECKGKSYAKSAKSINKEGWLNALGQLITRISVKPNYSYKYGLGLPQEGANVALRRIPWQVAKALNIYILSVDDRGKVKMFSPKDFKSEN